MEEQIGGTLTQHEKDLNLFDKKMLGKAFYEAGKSTANKRKVGAIIVNMEIGQELIISSGHNKMFKELVDYRCENSEGKSYECVVHAEESAIMYMFRNFGSKKFDKCQKTIYVTYSPCMNCAKLIVGAGIKRVVYCEEHEKNFQNTNILNGFSPKGFLLSMGVELVQYPSIVEILHQKPGTFELSVVTDLKDKISIESKQQKIALIYHSADSDGLMSGYLLSKIFRDEIELENADLIPYNYGTDDNFLRNREYIRYIFVDITPPIEWLEANIDKIGKEFEIEIFDHHAPKFDEIFGKFSNLFGKGITYNFCDTMSGCKILFNNYNLLSALESENRFKLELIVNLISDYDTWKFAEKDYKFHCEVIGIFTIYNKEDVLSFNMYLQQFHELDNFIKEIDYILQHSNFDNLFDKFILRDGNTIIKKIKSDNEQILSKGQYLEEFPMVIYQGYPNYFLQLQLLEKYPELKYWIGFQIDLEKHQISFSIRSQSQDDCNLIAKNFGGGGHKQAGGFKMKLIDGIKLIQNPQLILLYKKYYVDNINWKIPKKGNFYLNGEIITIDDFDEVNEKIRYLNGRNKIKEVSDWIDWNLLENRPFNI